MPPKKERMLGGWFDLDSRVKRVLDSHPSVALWNERGRNNFQRAIGIINALICEGSVEKLSRASRKQDKKGIDLFCHMMGEDEVIKAPVQIKSSAKHAERFRRSHEDNIVVLVVNDFRSDAEIQSDLLRGLKSHML